MSGEISTLEEKMKVFEGDHIVKGINNEFYACKPNVFKKTYELVEKDNVGDTQSK